MISLRAPWEIEKLRKSAALLVEIFREIERYIAPGVTTEELDVLAERMIRSKGGEPAFKGYRGYPKTVCTSIDEEVVHGIPSARKLREGDLLSLDIGVLYEGYYADAAKSYLVASGDPLKRRLLEVTREALHRGIRKCRVGSHVTDISHAIQKTVEAEGFSVVRDLVGHGIGTELHEEPKIPNYGPPGKGPRLKSGMVFAIEPMVNAGSHEVEILPDGWTVVTKDRKPSAHFEHTVVVTSGRPEILTIGIEDGTLE